MPVGYEQLVSTSFQHSKLPSYQHWQLSLNLVHGCWFSCRPGVWWPGVCTRKALKTYVYIYTGMYDYDHGRHTWRLWAGRQLKWGIRTYSSGNNTLTTSHRYDTEVCLPFLSTTKGTTTTTTLRHILTYLDTIYIYIRIINQSIPIDISTMPKSFFLCQQLQAVQRPRAIESCKGTYTTGAWLFFNCL